MRSRWQRSRAFLNLAAIAALVFPAGTRADGGPKESSASAWLVERLSTARAWQIGATRSGGAWLWFRESGRVETAFATGVAGPAFEVGQSLGVDYDEVWGLATLTLDRAVVVHRKQVATPRRISVGGIATSVAWLSEDQLAVALNDGRDLIQVVSVGMAREVRRIGTAFPPPPGPGLVLLRFGTLRIDHSMSRIWHLDAAKGSATAGVLEAFDYNGQSRATFRLGPNLFKPGIDSWALEQDASRRAKGERHEATVIGWNSAAIEPDGDFVVIRDCGTDGRTARIGRIDERTGVNEGPAPNSGCCGRLMTVLGDQMVFGVLSVDPQPACGQARRLP